MIATVFTPAQPPRRLLAEELMNLHIGPYYLAGRNHLSADEAAVAALLEVPLGWLAYLAGNSKYAVYARELAPDSDHAPTLAPTPAAAEALARLTGVAWLGQQAPRGPILIIEA